MEKGGRVAVIGAHPVRAAVPWAALLASVACGPPREVMRMSSAGATRPAVAAEVEALDPSAPHAWLYRVSGGDAAAPSYLLGTMHLGVTFRDAVPEPLDSTLFEARAVVMEVDLREAERFFASAPASPRPRREWLDRTLPDETWARLVTELGGRAPPEILRQLPPGALTLYLEQVRMAEVEAIEDGRTPVPGATSSTRLDRSIFQWAVSAGTPIVALETTEEALAAFASLEAVDATEALRAVLDDPEAARADARRLRDAYLSLDEARVLSVLAEMPDDARHAMLDVRNHAWMANLVPQIRSGDAFVAVGCGHLVGAGSVRELLEAEGYVVERVLGDGGLEPSGRADIRIH